MNLRTGFNILCCALCLSLLASCLGGNDAEEYIVSTDAEILSFSLSHDSVPDLANVVFSIDQINGLIYNHDSMAYGTTITEKAVVTYNSAAGFTNVLNVTNIASNDSAWIESGKDSLDVTKPARLRVYAPDGLTKKYYEVKLNIHQVDPDSVQYTRVAENQSFLNAEAIRSVSFQGSYYTYSKKGTDITLNRSTDAINWTSLTLTGFPAKAVVRGMQVSSKGLYVHTEDGELYTSSNAIAWQKATTEYPVKAILGYLNASSTQIEGLTLVVEKGGKLVYAITPNFNTYVYGYEVSAEFPLSDFSSLNLVSMSKQRVTTVGGISASGHTQNAAWSTQDGLYWAKLTDDVYSLFPAVKGANAFLYGNEIYLLNGQLSDGTYNKNVYYSLDGGVTWSLKPEKYSFPGGYTDRYNASLVLDEKGVNFYILGGKNNAVLTDIWQGFQNKKTFKY